MNEEEYKRFSRNANAIEADRSYPFFETALREKYIALQDEIYAELDKFFGEKHEGDRLDKKRPVNLELKILNGSIEVVRSLALLAELIESEYSENGFNDPYDLPDGLAVKICELSDLHDALRNAPVINKLVNDFSNQLYLVNRWQDRD